MKTAAKVIIINCGCLLMLLAAGLSLWKLRQSHYEPKRKEAMRFCESLVPLIEKAAQSDGRYPTTIDPIWIKGKRIPELIRIEDFYESENGGYLLRFRNPGDFWNDVWGYHGRGGTGLWINYDGY